MVKYLLFFALCSLGAEQAAVTYEFSGGRFGDCLMSYLHAKWFGYVHGIPVVYKPFIHSSRLAMDEVELRAHPAGTGYGRHYLAQGQTFGNGDSVLYICPYFPEDPWELKNTLSSSGEPYYSFQVDWKDQGFRQQALAMIAPKKELRLTGLSEGAIHVAVHVRDGGGYDFDDFRTRFPLKLPPMEFYIEGVRAMAGLFEGKTVEFYLFTDATMPEMVAKRIEEAVGVRIKYRKGANHFNLNVLEDFWSLFLFDAMIRPQSNFSMIPTLLKDFAVVYAPKECVVEGSGVRIVEVSTEINEVLYEKLME